MKICKSILKGDLELKKFMNKIKILFPELEVFMDLYPEDFKEQLDEVLEFAKYLKERGLWEDNMRIYKDKNGNLVAE